MGGDDTNTRMATDKTAENVTDVRHDGALPRERIQVKDAF